MLKSSDRYEYALKCGFYFNRLLLDDCRPFSPVPSPGTGHFRPGTSRSLHLPPSLPARYPQVFMASYTTFARALFCTYFRFSILRFWLLLSLPDFIPGCIRGGICFVDGRPCCRASRRPCQH